MSDMYMPWEGHINFPGAPTFATPVPAVVAPNLFVLPVDNTPNQRFETTLNIDGVNVTFGFYFRYNEIAGYWAMQVSNPDTGVIILDSMPLVSGRPPYANILAPFAYMGIGSAYVVPLSNDLGMDYPDSGALGNYFALVWGDTP